MKLNRDRERKRGKEGERRNHKRRKVSKCLEEKVRRLVAEQRDLHPSVSYPAQQESVNLNSEVK